jgi:predicted dehydrogenase
MNTLRILLVGAGRMGQRHLRGMAGRAGEVHIVDPDPQTPSVVAAVAGESGLMARLTCYATLEAALTAAPAFPSRAPFDAVILSATAAGRLESFEQIAARGIRDVLVEKPLEQSRARFRRFLPLIQAHGLRVRCNFYRRSLAAFHELRGQGPLVLSVSSGAMGLGCNGIHWIDWALFLSGSRGGRLLFGEIDAGTIASGRGPQFRDHGGRGVFAFDDGSRLFLSVRADSSAPTTFSIVAPGAHWLVDQNRDEAVVHRRRPDSARPNYLYGQDYETSTVAGVEQADLPALTAQWLDSLGPDSPGPACHQPTLEESAAAHELLFDLLETGGADSFAIT